MKNILSAIFLFWTAICTAFFVGLVVSAIYYSPESLLADEQLVTTSCLLFSALSFYFFGYKENKNKKYVVLCVIAIIINITYLAFWPSVQLSIYEINMIALIALMLFRWRSIINGVRLKKKD